MEGNKRHTRAHASRSPSCVVVVVFENGLRQI